MTTEIAAADETYVFHASRAHLRPLGPGLSGKEARMGDGLSKKLATCEAVHTLAS